MTNESINALFSLLAMEEDNFAKLLKYFELDPAKDLRNCDLTNVDFGTLEADVLDLTGATISGADLSKIRCKKIIGALHSEVMTHQGLEPSTRRTIKVQKSNARAAAVQAVVNYANNDWTISELVRSTTDNTAPIMAFYESSAEQRFITKALCSRYNDLSGPLSVVPRQRFVWFYSGFDKPRSNVRPENSTTIEEHFFETLLQNNSSEEIGVYPYLSNRETVSRIQQKVQECLQDKRAMQTTFAQVLGREMQDSKKTGIALFSGFPPISKRMYQSIRKTTHQRVKLIFLCPPSQKLRYENSPELWRDHIVPEYTIFEAMATEDDLRRIRRRIELVSSGLIAFSESFMLRLAGRYHRPLKALKAQIISDLQSAAANPSDGKIIL
ncbi:hypothetical protein BJ123_105109 [Rhodopseudomonas thermotolerans]|uniref:Pentapeptide repeat protein n=2 Tax=Rhodopseudomonas TaxID=1073 RepID=A0A336JK65_9BRAD|nr:MULTISPECIES: hypothetical protein [Rhodopseudomonas]RED38030.1 hypothetical protein BJ125_105109 [Rhodopseudomonas pentothenatexigens]REG05223.1 hypothetical protein BJ123_105109 [Rhodopseudomonas thermotolerans]SSW90055.1 hypothetical protein SAMN05892882_105109 [Rhodopseudomonas pentothenatexigens]